MPSSASADAARRRDGLPVPVLRGQIAPQAPGPGAKRDPVDYGAMVIPAVSLPRMRGKQRHQPVPLVSGEGMTIQALTHPKRSTPARVEDPRDMP